MLGMRLDAVAPATYVDAIVGGAERGEAFYCCVANVHMCVLAHDEPDFRAVVNGARFVIPDSTILQKARSLRYGAPSIPTLRGAEMMLELVRVAAGRGVKIGLVGGRDDETLALLIARLRDIAPDVDIAYAYSPPFRPLTEQEDAALVEDIRASGARLIFVGLGCPKQERWMAAHVERVPAVMIGVGAAFDFNAGVVRTSPEWVHKAGLEWLYRMSQEPKRLWRRYFSTSPRFVGLLLLDAVRRR